ncbi:ammonia-dependent NAD(+) synthetase [Kineococcus indalonis]|uniref:ammonia-dependent NAD(+) synthetase n=1 Tax=Kineococcus indalonis TaxID=2696566 RepID=UPI0014129CB5|nr:ammonia-dependent NAD(+) synthetase [Kineococcus indalonis]NAZ85011.1 ammonia-dependent NAD(+) synthetase [Kineococcus indalonis]
MADTTTGGRAGRVSGEQRAIAAELGVSAGFDAREEAERRTAFLADLLRTSGARELVLGISGGVDSAVTGMLCRRAVQQVPGTRFTAVRLPYGRQFDDADARDVLEAVQADEVLTVDVRPASDAALDAVVAAGLTFTDDAQRDFVHGNVKARERMVVQYAVAGARRGLVVGTDHAAEAITGFFTKYGDGGVDANPLSGLTKRRVRALGELLGLPAHIVTKTPTADLETSRPGRADEDALGLTYEQIDDFLEGLPVEDDVRERLVRYHATTAHKRALPATP